MNENSNIATWLDIIGIGEEGMIGLSPAARALVEDAEVIIGGDRHHNLSSNIKAMRLAWPSPFDLMIEKIKSFKGKRVVILVTGDPLWYSVGARISRVIDPAEICFHPHVSAFQLAACRMGWSVADVETLTIHGRPAQQIIPWFHDGARLLVLTKDASSPKEVAALLCAHGYGKSRMTVLAAMGGKEEQSFEGLAFEWEHDVPKLHTLALELIAGSDAKTLPLYGLPDSVFENDGTMTKQVVRAATLAKLAPKRGQLLWDIGAGCGAVAIEWMRAAPETRAVGVEPRADRRSLMAKNALKLGAPALHIMDGNAPSCICELGNIAKGPDAVFVGGGLSTEVLTQCIEMLKPGGRIVANAVTLDSETKLFSAFEKFGGELERIMVQQAKPLGKFTGWKTSMPVTQWFYTKSRNLSE